jgi:hypothetical protein
VKALWVAALLAASLAASAQEPTGAKEMFENPGGAPVLAPGGAATPDPQPPRPQLHRPARPQSATFGLKCWVELVEAPGSPGERVTHDRVFHSGEKIRLHFAANADGHISIVQIGSSGNASLLFPAPARGLSTNVLSAGGDRVLPSKDDWFRFDATPGAERLVVLFAKRQGDIDDSLLLQQMLDPAAAKDLVQRAKSAAGSKDLVLETVSNEATYAVNRVGELVVLELTLRHE